MQNPEIKSLSGITKKLVILLHGLGSDGHDLIGLVPMIQNDLPDCHFFSPHGIEAFDMASYGRQWFSLADRNPATILQLIKQNAPAIENTITEKQKELGLTNKETIIIGFSQGTMVGLYLTLMQDEPYNAMIGFSGRLIQPDDCINEQTPICLIHGDKDDIIEIESMHVAEKYLSSKKIPYVAHIVKNLKHSIDSQGIKHAIDFINNVKS